MYIHKEFRCYEDMVRWLNGHNIKPEHIINIVKDGCYWKCIVWTEPSASE